MPQYLQEFSSNAQRKNQDPQSYAELQLLRANAVFGSDNSIRQSTEKSNQNSEKISHTSRSSNGIDTKALRAIPITKIAEDLGFTVVKKGNGKKSLKEHDSVIIYTNTNTYYRFSEGKGGSAIDFTMNFCNLSAKEAIHYLRGTYLGQEGVVFSTPREQRIIDPTPPKEPEEFIA